MYIKQSQSIHNYTLLHDYVACNNQYAANVRFKASSSSAKLSSNRAMNMIEYTNRVVGNKLLDLFGSKKKKQIINYLANMQIEHSQQYLDNLIYAGSLYSSKKHINVEDQILKRLVQNDESTIFIMNHSNQSADPKMLAVLNFLLSVEYKKAGRDNFPFPKIILNQDILKTMNPTKRKAFENIGAVGIDASVIGGDKNVNTKVFLPLVKDFINNSCNIFIFPEGRLAVRKDLNFFNRFQGGVASLINIILAIKESVNVVPVGFAYGGKSKGLDGKKLATKKVNGMSIGTPIVIKRVGDNTTISSGDINKKRNSILYPFFSQHDFGTDVTITSKGKPVKPDDIPGYLKTILCENLDINVDRAKELLTAPIENVERY